MTFTKSSSLKITDTDSVGRLALLYVFALIPVSVFLGVRALEIILAAVSSNGKHPWQCLCVSSEMAREGGRECVCVWAAESFTQC